MLPNTLLIHYGSDAPAHHRRLCTLKCCRHTLGLLFRVCAAPIVFLCCAICVRLLTSTCLAWPDCRTHPQPLRTQGKAAAREKRVHAMSRQLQLRTDFVGRLCGRVHELIRLALPTLPRFEMPGPSWEAVERAAGDSLNRVRARGW